MSDTTDGEVQLIELPDPGTVGMVNALGQIMEGVVNSIPFRFTCADLMAAHLKSAFEVGMMNATDPSKLRDNLVEGLNAMLVDILESRGTKH